jgi:hypothetical protein
MGSIPFSSRIGFAFLIAVLSRRPTLEGVCRVPWLLTNTGSLGFVCKLVGVRARRPF